MFIIVMTNVSSICHRLTERGVNIDVVREGKCGNLLRFHFCVLFLQVLDFFQLYDTEMLRIFSIIVTSVVNI